jgi:hypothetical protein
VDVVDAVVGEQAIDRGVDLTGALRALAGDERAVGAVGVEGQAATAQRGREAAVGVVARAAVLVDEDRARQRQVDRVAERVVREEQAALLVRREAIEADAARRGVGRDLGVRGVRVVGALEGPGTPAATSSSMAITR